jgi:hypothetical protein
MEDRAYSRLEYHHPITRTIFREIPARQAAVDSPALPGSPQPNSVWDASLVPETDDVHVGFLVNEQPAAFTGVDVFHTIEREYILEIGSERFRLKSGDSILAPREVPHAWAFVSDTAGKMLIAFAPAKKMEAFFREAMNSTTMRIRVLLTRTTRSFFTLTAWNCLAPR